MYDLIIIGAGPAGLSAGLHAKELGLNYLILERKRIANTIADYSDDKPVLDYPKNVEVLGNLEFHEMEREELLEKWSKTAESLNIKFEEAIGISGNYTVKTKNNEYEAKFVVLATGVQGRPRELDVEGKEKIKYKFEDVSNCNVLIIGGGDSAAEAAVKLSEKCNVVLSYRKPDFFRMKPENVEKIKNSKVDIILESEVCKVNPDQVCLNTKEGKKDVLANHIFAFTGNILPSEFLEKLGLKVENGKPVYDEKYEAKQNFFVAGDLTKEPLIKNAINHGFKIVEEIKKRLVI